MNKKVENLGNTNFIKGVIRNDAERKRDSIDMTKDVWKEFGKKKNASPLVLEPIDEAVLKKKYQEKVKKNAWRYKNVSQETFKEPKKSSRNFNQTVAKESRNFNAS